MQVPKKIILDQILPRHAELGKFSKFPAKWWQGFYCSFISQRPTPKQAINELFMLGFSQSELYHSSINPVLPLEAALVPCVAGMGAASNYPTSNTGGISKGAQI